MTHKRPETESELVEFVRSIDVRAPASLHADVNAMVAQHNRRRTIGARVAGVFQRGITPRLVAVGGAVAAAAVALAIALSVGGTGTSVPTLRATAALTLLPATASAPSHSQTHRATLAAAVDGVYFPYWEDSLGWRSTGARADRLGGRPITTVFYSDRKGERVGYAIVGGGSAPGVTGGTIATRGGVSYRLFTQSGRAVVTWVRDGHMCVLSAHGRDVSAATLLDLASWHAAASA
jgi:hypothetical protein